MTATAEKTDAVVAEGLTVDPKRQRRRTLSNKTPEPFFQAVMDELQFDPRTLHASAHAAFEREWRRDSRFLKRMARG